MALGIAGFAQQPDPTAKPTTSPPATQQKAEQQKPAEAAAQDVMIAGCVQSEAEYRRAQDAGKGGVAGTGVGAGNEFVLINASMAGGAAGGAAPSDAGGSTAGQPTGTAGVSAAMSAYELTGANEGQLAQHVGKRVEITGKLKAAEIGASGPTGGPTAGAPPRGVDVTSEDLKLRELEVMSVRETTGACPAAKS
jgi:hypothetical protein